MRLHEWLLVFVMASSGALMGMVFTPISPVLPLIIEHYRGVAGGPLVGQWILAIPSLGVIVGAPLVGWFVERFGARQVLHVCFAIFAIAGSAGLYIEVPLVLLGTRLILGFAAAGVVTAAITVVGEVYSDIERARIFGLQSGISVAMGVLIVLAAGAAGQSQGWRGPFELYFTSIIVLLVSLFVVPQGHKSIKKGIDVKAGSGLLPLLPIYILVTLTFILSFVPASALPELLASTERATPTTISIVLGVGMISFAITAVSYGTILARVGMRRTIVLGLASQSAGVLLMALAHGKIGIILFGVAVLNLGSGVQTPNLSHLLLGRAPLAVRGRALGLLFTAQFLGPVLYSAIVPLVTLALGIKTTMIVVGGLAMTGAALIARWHSPSAVVAKRV